MSMKCDCGDMAKLIDGTDDGSEGQFCFNLYLCDGCGSIYKEDIAYRCFYKLDNCNFLTRLEEIKYE